MQCHFSAEYFTRKWVSIESCDSISELNTQLFINEQVYNATLGKQPGIFYLTIATQMAVFVLML